MGEASVADAGPPQVEFLQLAEAAERCEALVGNERIANPQTFEAAHALEVRQPLVVEGRESQVQRFEILKRRQRMALDLGAAYPDILEVLQPGDLFEAFVVEPNIGQETVAESELLEAGQGRDMLEVFALVLVRAGARVPHRPWQVQFLESAQGAQARQIRWVDVAADKVENLQAKIHAPEDPRRGGSGLIARGFVPSRPSGSAHSATARSSGAARRTVTGALRKSAATIAITRRSFRMGLM